MTRIDAILHHPLFVQILARLETLEADRIYCRHGLPHLLDTARIAYLLQYEECQQKHSSLLPLPAEQIYAAALLHDIGRVRQYEEGLPHEIAALPLAKQILSECHFDKEEQTLILSAIHFHCSGQTDEPQNHLQALLQRADTLSRCCFCCPASESCHWPNEKKNSSIVW